ncbi:MAG: VWA domain-containing protein [Acidobacteriota bacterium]|nr:VWA domain-containing protein [Acidobacteriota bacterium]
MRKLILAPALVFLLALVSFSQTLTPTPKLVAEDDDVVKISTTLIQVDVTVTDKNGKIITGLKPEDFKISENGESQEITNFSFVSASSDSAQTPLKAKEGEKLSNVPLPSVPIKSDQVRRTIALVVDDLGLSFESVYRVRRALRKFVDEQMQANDLVAIIRTGSGAGALQQFTTDKRQLYAAIENVKWNSLGRSGIDAFAPLEATPLEQSQAAGNTTVTQEDLEEERKQLQDFSEFREDIFSVGTLGAINFIVKGMNDLPGRKSIMLFSDGFAICSPENPDRCARIVDSVRKLTDLSNRAAVSIYSFDARGLLTTGITAQDNTSGVSAERIQNLSNTRSGEIFDKQEGLAYLAGETGGRTFFNNNDINRGLEKALEDQRGYYLIGYQPDSNTFDAKTRRFNKLKIEVNRKDVSVRYRSGFFGVTDEQIKKPVNQTAAQQIYTSLNSPFAASDIALHMNTLFGNDKQQGSFVRSLLHVNAKDLKFVDEAGGSKKAVFDVLAISFGEDGAVIDQIGKTYTMNVRGDAYQKLLNDGFVYYFTFPVKKPGAYQYRVAIRDGTSEKIGSANQFIEVPNLKKARLTISGITLENLTVAQWQKFGSDSAGQTTASGNSEQYTTNAMIDTALRKFKRDTVLRYGFEVYNAKFNASQKLNLTTQIRIFRDSKLIFEGKNAPFELLEQTDLQRAKSAGALSLGKEMATGDYVLQVIITDNLAKEKRRIGTQFVQFEIVN